VARATVAVAKERAAAAMDPAAGMVRAAMGWEVEAEVLVVGEKEVAGMASAAMDWEVGARGSEVEARGLEVVETGSAAAVRATAAEARDSVVVVRGWVVAVKAKVVAVKEVAKAMAAEAGGVATQAAATVVAGCRSPTTVRSSRQRGNCGPKCSRRSRRSRGPPQCW